jgi:hypothetical protein
MKLLNITYVGWKQAPDGVHVGPDGMDRFIVVAHPDFNGTPNATVIFNGIPVLVVRGEDYDGRLLRSMDVLNDQCVANFMESCLGEFSEGATTALADGMDWEEVEDKFADGQGYEFIRFIGIVAKALYAAYPDDLTIPKGF